VITTSDALVPLLLRACARITGSSDEHDRKIRLVITDDERELEPGSIDMALRPTGAPRRSLRGRRLGSLAVGVYQRKGGPKLTTWIAPSDEMRRRISMRWFRRMPAADAREAMVCDRLVAMRDACAAGLGRAMLPCALAEGDPRLERLESVEGDGTPLWLFVATNNESSFRSFADALTRELRAEKGAWTR